MSWDVLASKAKAMPNSAKPSLITMLIQVAVNQVIIAKSCHYGVAAKKVAIDRTNIATGFEFRSRAG